MKTYNLLKKSLIEDGYTESEAEEFLQIVIVALQKFSFSDIVSLAVEPRYDDLNK